MPHILQISVVHLEEVLGLALGKRRASPGNPVGGTLSVKFNGALV